jgi:hypothetical protein
MTLFLGLPHPLAARLWDLFLFYGFDVLIHAGITLLFCYQETLVRLDFEKSMQLLTRCEDQAENIHVDRFIRVLKDSWSDSQKSSHHSVGYLRSIYQSKEA